MNGVSKLVDFEASLYLEETRPKLAMNGMMAKLDELAEIHQLYLHEKTVYLYGQLTPQKKLYKTRPQLGYLFGHLGPVCLQYLNDNGWPISTKEQAVEFMKPELGFYDTYYNEKTKEEVHRVLSVADADIDRVYGFVRNLYVTLLEKGCSVMSPEEYKKRKRWQ